jgi:hypothetical protein
MQRRFLALVLAVPLMAGCYVGEGDYVVFRVAVERTVIADPCFTEDNPRPPEEAASSSSFLTPLTWTIYYGAGDKVVLDAAGVGLGGEETSEGFEFKAHTVNVDYDGINNLEAKITVTTETTLNIKQSGASMNGEVLDVVTTACDFLTATPSSGLCTAISNCERRTKFTGVELDDVNVDTTINEPNPI